MSVNEKFVAKTTFIKSELSSSQWKDRDNRELWHEDQQFLYMGNCNGLPK